VAAMSVSRRRGRVDNGAATIAPSTASVLARTLRSGTIAHMSSNTTRLLLVLVLAHAAASLLHFVHNATYLAEYPNMPGWISPAGVYAVWLAEAAIGAAGIVVYLRGRPIGLALIAIFAVLGLGGLDHYVLAPIAAHTTAMNATIWLEMATGVMLLAFVLLRRASLVDLHVLRH
jgi:hypothetical protein